MDILYIHNRLPCNNENLLYFYLYIYVYAKYRWLLTLAFLLSPTLTVSQKKKTKIYCFVYLFLLTNRLDISDEIRQSNWFFFLFLFPFLPGRGWTISNQESFKLNKIEIFSKIGKKYFWKMFCVLIFFILS